MAKSQNKKEKAKTKSKQALLERIKIKAAGIDIGSSSIFVAIIDKQVKSFDTYTSGIKEAVRYLKANGIKSVALEATGIYWFPIYEAIEEAGIEIYVVNGGHVKNVPGRKTDVLDSEWLRELHTYGLLRSSFVPNNDIRKLRHYMRLRNDHISSGASYIQHIQKNFDAMNLKLHNVINDIMGKSGQRVVRAIIAGERSPHKLLALCNPVIQNSKAHDVLKSLEGNYREEFLFGARQALEMWDIYQQKIADCDKEIEKLLAQMTKGKVDPEKLSPKKQIPHHKPQIKDFHRLMIKLTDNKDATRIAGINDYTLLQLVSETGLDLSKWLSEKHFTSWLGLAPSANSSGKQGNRKRRKKRPVNNAGKIFKQIARNAGNGKHCALAGFYRRIKSRSGASIANKATARKIAVYYYNLMTKGFDFVDEGLKKYEERYAQQQLRFLEKRAKEMGLKLVAA